MYSECRLCARRCHKNRSAGEIGYCRMTDEVKISRAALHFWEEPPISGERGSGTVFFSGCSLGCVYCQNREISRGESGIAVSEERLADIYLELSAKGAHNVNLVTPTHYVPSVINSVANARGRGLDIPIVYNTAAYEEAETVDALRDTVDIWLPDLKYYREKTALEYSNAKDLPSVSRAAIDRMVDIAGECVFDEYGMMRRGVIVRILLLPSHLAEAKLNLKYLYERYKDRIYLSLMSQYTPPLGMKKPLNRRVSVSEYDELVNYALKLGVKNAFIQERSSAAESFIPPFDNTGVLSMN